MPSEPGGSRRLHPLSVVRDVPLREIATGLIPAVLAAGNVGPRALVALGVSGLAVLGAWRLVVWRAHTYRLTDSAVVERRGVLNRRERVVELDRIQQVELSRSLLDRLAGTAEVVVETASEAGESELRLRVVAESEARRLRARLRPERATGGVTAEQGRPPSRTVISVPLPHVVLSAVTGSRLLVVPVLIAGLVGVLGDLGLLRAGAREAGAIATSLPPVAAVGLALLTVALGVAAAAVVGVVRDGGFVVTEQDGELRVRRGLVATREAVVARSRLQQVSIHRSWIRRLLGYATLTMHSAGGGGREADGLEQRSLTVPLVAEAAVEPTVSTLIGYRPLPDLTGHPRAAWRRTTVRWAAQLALGGLATAVALLWVSVPAALLVAPAVVLAAPLLGWTEYRHLASGANRQLVGGRTGALSTTTRITPRRRSQGTTVAVSLLQRRSGLASLHVHVAGPAGLRLRDLAEARARSLAEGLLPPGAQAGRSR